MLKNNLKTKLVLTIAMSMLLHVGSTQAASMSNVHVTYVGTYGNGDIYVGFDATLNEPGCANARIDIPASATGAKNVLAQALLAKAAGLAVSVASTGCYNGSPTLPNQAVSSFFYIN